MGIMLVIDENHMKNTKHGKLTKERAEARTATQLRVPSEDARQAVAGGASPQVMLRPD